MNADEQMINMSESNKRKDPNYMKNYYQNNKEKWVEYRKANPEEHREYMRNYMRNYPKEKKYANIKKQLQDYEGMYIYFIIDENNKMKYCGKTTNTYRRFHAHKSTAEKYNHETDTILYLDFTGKLSEDELGDMEKYFIELFNNDLNFQAGEYDGNIIDKLPKKLKFYEFRFNED